MSLKVFRILFIMVGILNFRQTTLFAQEKEFKEALDSLNYYLRFATFDAMNNPARLRLVTQYNPIMYNSMDEESSDQLYKNRAGENKQIIFLTNGAQIYIIDLKKINEDFITESRNGSIKIADPKDSVEFIYTLVVREWNGRGGLLQKEIMVYLLSLDKAKFIHDKLDFFFRKVILTSKQVK